AVGLVEGITHEPDEKCPLTVSATVGLQGVLLAIPPTVLTMSLFARASGLGERYLAWSVLAAIIISGIATALQAARLGRLGGGHNLVSGTASGFVAVGLLAVNEAGLETLTTLVVVSSVLQLALGGCLRWLRRIITPVVSGVVLMLISVGIMQIVVARLGAAEGAPALAEPAVAAVTVAGAAVLGLRAKGVLRLWSPLVGVLAGCVAAGAFGLYSAQRVLDAPWIGVPEPWFPGFDLTPDRQFWALLPMFLIVSTATAIKTVGGSVALQRVSWREPRVTDYRLVQGAVSANGVCGVLSGIAGTLPTWSFEAMSVSLTNFTGVAARRVGYAIGIVLVALTFLPKVTALLLTIPDPVISAYLLVIMGMLFVEGFRTVLQDGLEPRKALIVGLSLAVGIGLQGENAIADLIGGTWGTLLGDGLTMGTLTAVLLTVFIEVSSPRRRRLELELNMNALPKIDGFLETLATSIGWDEASTSRLRFVGEESLSSLLEMNEDEAPRRLIVVARPGAGLVELEFLAVLAEENIQDQLAYLSNQTDATEQREVSLRLLRHFASAVRHRKYSGIDIVTVEVEGSR
ncbi:MAG: hypothetical protein F4Z89_12500, partial [Acidimicrobiaceae bacterium]|nr:hypothetical protein [Acidimicrobiaceae bacterium]